MSDDVPAEIGTVTARSEEASKGPPEGPPITEALRRRRRDSKNLRASPCGKGGVRY